MSKFLIASVADFLEIVGEISAVIASAAQLQWPKKVA